MKKLLLFPFCLLSSIFCFSQEWFPIDINDGVKTDVDISSIKRAENRIYYWEKETCEDEDTRLKEAKRMNKIKKNKKWRSYNHTLHYIAYDCSGKKYQILSSIYYDANGNVLFADDRDESDSNYIRLIPGTVGMSIFDALNDEHLFRVDGVKHTVYIEEIPYFIYQNPIKTEYLGSNSGIKLMTLEIIFECLRILRETNLDSN